MGYQVKQPASALVKAAEQVYVPTYAFTTKGDGAASWTVTDAKTDEVRFTGPTGLGTPTSLVLHLNQIQDWYKGKPWVDASAIPAVRSATRMNATYTENLVLQDSANVLDTKILPVQASLNFTIPNCENLLEENQIYDLYRRAIGALLSTIYDSANTGNSPSFAFANLTNRLKGVLKPSQFSGK